MIDWIAYGYAQRTEKNAETFGTGDVRGVIAPESSNNAKEGGHLVPTIAFGVPAGASMAILLGAFLMHGLTPGPEMLTKHLDVTYTIVWSLTLAHVHRRGDLPRLQPLSRDDRARSAAKSCCRSSSRWCSSPRSRARTIGAICIRCSFFGMLGWIMKRLGWPRPPMVLGLVIGGIFERYLFISTELYGWAWMLRPGGARRSSPASPGRCTGRLSQIVRDIAKRAARYQAPSASPHRVSRPSRWWSMVVIVSRDHLRRMTGRRRPSWCRSPPAGLALSAAGLNLVNELFGKQTLIAIGGSADSGSEAGTGGLEHGLTPQTVRWRATAFFAWIALLFALVCADRLHPRDRRVRVRLHVARVRRALVIRRSATPPAPRRSAGRSSTGRCWCPGRRRCWASGCRSCAPRPGCSDRATGMARLDKYHVIGLVLLAVIAAVWIAHFVLPAPPPIEPGIGG